MLLMMIPNRFRCSAIKKVLDNDRATFGSKAVALPTKSAPTDDQNEVDRAAAATLLADDDGTASTEDNDDAAAS